MRKIFVILAIALALLVALRDDARAQSPALEVGSARPFTIGGVFVFSAKFLCGTIGGPGLPLAAGTYLTAINIHNLNTSESAVVTIAVNGILKFDTVIGVGSILNLDCRNIVPGTMFPSPFPPSTPFSEGFVTLRFSKAPRVNVVPIYTVTAPVPGDS